MQILSTGDHKYEVIGQLGEGHFAIVSQVRNKDTGQLCALKQYRNNIDPRAREKVFQRESKMVTMIPELWSQYIESTSHQLTNDHYPFLTTILIDATNYSILYSLCDHSLHHELSHMRTSFSDSELLVFTTDLLHAVACLHRANRMHSDISTKNILVQMTNTGKHYILADYGDCDTGDDQVRDVYTDHKSILCPPEMVVTGSDHHGQWIAKYDKMVDLWNLGIVLLSCMLSCSEPELETEVQRNESSTVESNSPLIVLIISKYPLLVTTYPRCWGLLCQMLHESPMQRKSAEHLLTDLANINQ